MRKLSELFEVHGSDKHTGGKDGHSYGAVYDELLTPLRGQIHSVLELGVLGGASLRAWRDFFPDSFVIGLDLNVPPREEWQISVRKADVTKKEDLDAVLGDKSFDLLIDDASHWPDDQVKSFELLRHRLRPGGLAIIEDIQHQETHQRLRDLGFEIIDLRGLRARFDDVLAIYRVPAV